MHRSEPDSRQAPRRAREANQALLQAWVHDAAAHVLASLTVHTAAQVSQEEPPGPDGNELTLMLTRVTTSTARLVNDLIAEELDRRLAQWAELSTKERQGLPPS